MISKKISEKYRKGFTLLEMREDSQLKTGKNFLMGFTLIELLVVIAIIAILAVLIIIRIGTAQNDARTTRVKSDLEEIKKTANTAKAKTGRYLKDLTNSGCSACGCLVEDLRNIPDSHACAVSMRNAFNNLRTNSGLSVTGDPPRDSWGSPYLLDENEGEGGGCSKDNIWSVGPDGFHNSSDDIYTSSPIDNIICLN